MLLISCQGSSGVVRITSNNRQHLFLAFCVTLCRILFLCTLLPKCKYFASIDAVRSIDQRGGWIYYMILIGQKFRGNACCLPWSYCEGLFLVVCLSLQQDQCYTVQAVTRKGCSHQHKDQDLLEWLLPEEYSEGSFNLLNISSLFKWTIGL